MAEIRTDTVSSLPLLTVMQKIKFDPVGHRSQLMFIWFHINLENRVINGRKT